MVIKSKVVKLYNKLHKKMLSYKDLDNSLPTNLEYLKVKGKMKREVIPKTDKRKDGRVQFLRVPLLRNPEERN